MRKIINSHRFENVYKELKIDIDTLGCVMLDIEPKQIHIPSLGWLYYAKNKKRFWIDGYVFNKVAHLTLLYGLLDSGKKWEKHIKEVLKGWEFNTVVVESIGYFDSPYKDEPYYCIVAHIKVTEPLLEGHQRLEFLPHINTFNGYSPHITLAYVKKKGYIKDDVIRIFSKLIGKRLKVKSLNVGR